MFDDCVQDFISFSEIQALRTKKVVYNSLLLVQYLKTTNLIGRKLLFQILLKFSDYNWSDLVIWLLKYR